MAAPKGTLIPRVDGSAETYGVVARNRIRALFDEALDGLQGPKRRRHASGADLIERIQDALLEAPIASLAAIEKMLPGADKGQGGQGNVNIGALYLQAVQQAQPIAQVVDVTPEASGYIEGTGPANSLETLQDW